MKQGRGHQNRGQVFTGVITATFEFGTEAALDFNRPQAMVRPGQEQVAFGTAAGAMGITLR